MKKLIYRHGDVLLEEVDSIPSETTKKTEPMLAAGEETNHGHFATGDVTILEKDGDLYVKTHEKGGFLKHLLINEMKDKNEVWTKEHIDIELPPNKTFKVVRQVEFDPYEKKINEVKD